MRRFAADKALFQDFVIERRAFAGAAIQGTDRLPQQCFAGLGLEEADHGGVDFEEAPFAPGVHAVDADGQVANQLAVTFSHLPQRQAAV